MKTKNFIFTVDDNIRFLRELTEGDYASIFEHPYLALYKRLHDRYGLKVQLNLFYETDDFDLSEMTCRYRSEWRENSDWLRMSFHSRRENVRPYELSEHSEVYLDKLFTECAIVSFACEESLAKTTTIHYCLLTSAGVDAVTESGTCGLLGLYGTDESPRTSYQTSPADAERIRSGETIYDGGIAYAGIDVILNLYETEEILSRLAALADRDTVKVMIHEQYFYPDYKRYQPNFEQKLDATFDMLTKNGYKSVFFEDII